MGMVVMDYRIELIAKALCRAAGKNPNDRVGRKPVTAMATFADIVSQWQHYEEDAAVLLRELDEQSRTWKGFGGDTREGDFFRVGNWSMEIMGPSPIWCRLHNVRDPEQVISRWTHADLRDLEYIVQSARIEARRRINKFGIQEEI